MDLKKKIKNHIFTNNHVTLIDLIPLQYMCKERLSPTEVTPVFSQYALKFLLITFFSEYLKMMFFLIPDNPRPVQRLNLEKSGEVKSRQDHHILLIRMSAYMQSAAIMSYY